MMTELIVTDAPDDADHAAVLDGLSAFNRAETDGTSPLPLAVLIKGADGATMGGLIGRTWLEWLYIELLYVPDGLRGTGVGRALMLRAEAEAWARGCRGIWLNTFSFQARGFYEKLGYSLIGQIEDYPPGHRRFFLQKRI
jgi:GNAT superfamily N-acetyltransferase